MSNKAMQCLVGGVSDIVVSKLGYIPFNLFWKRRIPSYCYDIKDCTIISWELVRLSS